MAQIRPDEIARVLRAEIENYEKAVNVTETGSVISVGDGIARVYGLENVMAGELIEFPHNVSGIALNLEEDQVGAVLLGEYQEIKEGDEVSAIVDQRDVHGAALQRVDRISLRRQSHPRIR